MSCPPELRALRRAKYRQAEKCRDQGDRLGMRIAAKIAAHREQDCHRALLEMVRLDDLQRTHPHRVVTEFSPCGSVYWLREVREVEAANGGAGVGEAAEPRNLREQLGAMAGFLAGGTSRPGATDARIGAPLDMTPEARSAVSQNFVRGEKEQKGLALAGGSPTPREKQGAAS